MDGLADSFLNFTSAGEGLSTRSDVCHLSKEGRELQGRLSQLGKRIWHILPISGDEFFLWSQGNQIGIASLQNEIVQNIGNVSFASLSCEGVELHITAVVERVSVHYFSVNISTFQIFNPLSSWVSQQHISQVMKVPKLHSLVCHHSASLSVLQQKGTEWRVFAVILLASETRFTHLNMTAIESASVIVSSYQDENQLELNVAAIDIQRLFSLPTTSSTPLQLETGVLHATLSHPVTSCVLDPQCKFEVYPVPSSSNSLYLSPENISFGVHAFCSQKGSSVSRFEIRHVTVFDKIAAAAPQQLLALNNIASSSSNGVESSLDACLIVTPILSRGGRGESVIDVQVTDALDQTTSIWQACLLSSAHLASRHFVYTDNRTPALEQSAKFRQGLLWDAAVAARHLLPLLQCLTKSPNSSASSSASPAAGSAMHFRFHDAQAYAVENIQDVFDWALGDDAQSLQQTFRLQVRQLMGDNLPPLLMRCESKASLRQEYPTRVAATNEQFVQVSVMAEALEDISDTLYQRKMTTLREEQILQGGAERSDIVFARDLASHSVAQLQLYRRLAQFQRQYVDVMSYIWHHQSLTFSAFAGQSHPQEEVLTRLQEVVPAIDQRYLPESIASSASLVYTRLCRDILRTKLSSSWKALVNEPQISSPDKLSPSTDMAVDEQEQQEEVDTDARLIKRDPKDVGRHPPSFQVMYRDVLVPLLNVQISQEHTEKQLGTALLTPLVLLYEKIHFILQNQLYDGLTMQALEEVLEHDIHHLRRVWLYLLLLSFVVSYKRTHQPTESSQTNANIFAHEFIEECFRLLNGSDDSQPNNHINRSNPGPIKSSVSKEELHMLLACVLIDLDDTTQSAETNPTHFQHVVTLFTTNHQPDAFLLQPQPLRQFPYLSELFEYIDFTSEQGGSPTLAVALRSVSEASRHRYNDLLSLQSIGFAVIQRWICRGHYTAANLFQTIAPYPRHVRPGILSWIASIPNDLTNSNDDGNWRRIWEEARAKAEAICFPSESLQTLQEVTQFLCAWTIVHGCFAAFIESENLHFVEMEEITAFLAKRAEVEVARGLCPAAAVDTLIGFLLQHRRVSQARDWDHRHQRAVVGNNNVVSDPEVKRLLEERSLLIQAASAGLWTIPEVDYNLARNLQRGHHIVQRLSEMEVVGGASSAPSSSSSSSSSLHHGSQRSGSTAAAAAAVGIRAQQPKQSSNFESADAMNTDEPPAPSSVHHKSELPPPPPSSSSSTTALSSQHQHQHPHPTPSFVQNLPAYFPTSHGRPAVSVLAQSQPPHSGFRMMMASPPPPPPPTVPPTAISGGRALGGIFSASKVIHPVGHAATASAASFPSSSTTVGNATTPGRTPHKQQHVLFSRR